MRGRIAWLLTLVAGCAAPLPGELAACDQAGGVTWILTYPNGVRGEILAPEGYPDPGPGQAYYGGCDDDLRWATVGGGRCGTANTVEPRPNFSCEDIGPAWNCIEVPGNLWRCDSAAGGLPELVRGPCVALPPPVDACVDGVLECDGAPSRYRLVDLPSAERCAAMYAACPPPLHRCVFAEGWEPSSL